MRFVEYAKKRDLNKKLINQFGKYKVYTVDGENVRKINQAIHEFGDSAIHPDYPTIIPNNEIWIDEVTRPREIFFISAQALREYRLIDAKIKHPYDKSLLLDKKIREIMDNMPFRPQRKSDKGPKEVYIKKYGTIDEGEDEVVVWRVNGEFVRDEFKTDYIEGGHGYVYKWIPVNEIWIENNLHESEIPLIILHEFTEREIMKYKYLSYDKSHVIASKVEFAHEGKFNKENALSLFKDKALEMAKPYLK